MTKDTEAREKVARLIAAGNHGDPWWWKQAFDDGSDETAVRLRADDVSVADTILAALATPATNELGFDPTAEVGDEVFPHDTIGSHFGNGGGLGPAAGEVAPVGDYHVTSAQYEAAVKGRQDFRQAYREQLNLLSQKEWAAVAQIGADQELSTSAVLRQAVRLYQMHLYRLKAGETLSWSGDEQRAKDFAGPLYAHPPHPSPVDEEPTWPEWASSLLDILREYTGPCPEDGYEGVDLPEELRTWFDGYRDELIRTGKLAPADPVAGGEALREALEPFAKAADECDGAPDEMAISDASYEEVTVGHCRQAREALAALKGPAA